MKGLSFAVGWNRSYEKRTSSQHFGYSSGANSVFHRARAADKLHNILASDPDNANSIVIAHSHGGNVAFRAISRLGSRGARIHLITLATPFLRVFPTWSGPGFWLLLMMFTGSIAQLLQSLYPLPDDSTDLIHVVILIVLASIPSALLTYFIINPSPPEAKRQLALQNKTWASRPFTIAEKTNYDSASPDVPNLLVIRGVDDEAALTFAFGAIATRINRLSLGVLWKVVLLLAFLPVLGIVLLTALQFGLGMVARCHS
jgi:pimeloyl-ACP methyl ester carboxylesterase